MYEIKLCICQAYKQSENSHKLHKCTPPLYHKQTQQTLKKSTVEILIKRGQQMG